MPTRKQTSKTGTTASGNVFADLGLANAAELAGKAELALDINLRICERCLTQKKAAAILGIDQPKVSALSTGRLSLFSMETLMSYIVLPGGEVDVIVKKSSAHPQIGVVRMVEGENDCSEAARQPQR